MSITLSYNKLIFSLGLLFLCGCETPSLESIGTPYIPVASIQRPQNAIWNEVLKTATSIKPLTVKIFTKDDTAHFLVLQIDYGQPSPIFATVGVLSSTGG